MKKNLSSLLLGLLVTVAFFSCSKDDEEISVEAGIVGKWTVESADVMLDGKSLEDYIEEVTAQLAAQFGEEYAEMYAEILSDFDMGSEMNGVTIEFKEDKTAITTDEDGSESGTWSVSGKMLTVTFDGVPQTFEVRSISGSKASLYAAVEEEGLDQSPMKIESIINLKK